MKKHWFLFIIILFFFLDCWCQSPPKPIAYPQLSIGNAKGTRIHIDSVKANPYIFVGGGMPVKSINMFFSGTNFRQVVGVTSTGGSSMYTLMNVLDKCAAGTIMTIEWVTVQTDTGPQKYYYGKSFVFYSGKDSIDSHKSTAETNKELYDLIKKEFLTGTIYFSGSSFTNVITVTKKDFHTLSGLFARCAPGSIITFDNCVYKEPDGTLSNPLSKSIKLQ